MPDIKRSNAIPGTDVAHFFDLSPKVGQRGPNYRGVSMWDLSNGSPGWVRSVGGKAGAAAAPRGIGS
jgi:hypothetical protein